jgi:hydrogenase maturation factor HypE
MADHGVLEKKDVAATNVNSYNRYAMAGSSVDLDNGNVFRLDTQNTASYTGYSEVWDVSAPSLSGSTLNKLWMAGTFAVNKTIDGTLTYRGLNDDPRKFYNSGSSVFDAYKPQPGDVIVLTADAFSGTVSASSVYLNAEDASYELVVGSAQTTSALSYKLLATTYISVGIGTPGSTQRVTAYKYECLAN